MRLVEMRGSWLTVIKRKKKDMEKKLFGEASPIHMSYQNLTCFTFPMVEGTNQIPAHILQLLWLGLIKTPYFILIQLSTSSIFFFKLKSNLIHINELKVAHPIGAIMVLMNQTLGIPCYFLLSRSMQLCDSGT